MKKSLTNSVFVLQLYLVLLSQLAIAKKTIYIDKSLKDFPIATNVSPNTFQLFSHGRSGELLLNGEWKNAQQIADFLKPQIRNPKSEIRNLNIYGCEFAKGQKGLEAVSYLEKTLKISVSASTNITGINGDWVLEVGKAKNVISVGNYKGNLQTCTVPVASGSNQPHINWDRNSTGYPGTMENNDFSPVVTKTGSNITAGSGLTMTNSGSAWGLTNLTATTLAAAKTANQYMQFIIPTTASGTSTYTLTHWTTFYASNAPANLAIEISTDPTFATSTLLYDGPDANTNNGLYFQTPLNQNYVLSNSTTYYVRLYPLGTGSKLLDSFGFNGTCSATNCGTAPTSATTTVCQTGTIAGTCTSPAVRTYYSDAALTTIVANPLTSTGTYYMACVSGTAPNSCKSAGVSFTVTAAPTAPSVTPTSICNGQSTTLSGNCTSGTLTWFTADNTSLTTAKLASATVTPTVNTTYYAACIDGTCKSTSTPDLITVNALPAVPSATTAVAICNNGSTANLVGTCVAPAVTKWYTAATGGTEVTSPVSPTATTIYYASCINNTTGCESATRRALTVTVNPLPVLTVTPTSSTICSGTTFSAAVKSTLVGSYTATATVISGTATGANNIASTSLPTANTAVTYTSGVIANTGTSDAVVRYVFTPTATTGTCVGATVTQDVTIKPVVAPTVIPETICVNTGTTLQGSCTTGTLQWYAAANPTIATATISATLASPVSATATTKTYYAACVSNGCISASTADIITVIAKPTTTPVVSGTANICSGASTSISSSSTCNSGTLTWYSDATLTTQVGTGSPLSVSPTTTTSYYASCVNGSCKGTASAAVPITVTSTPNAPSGLTAAPSTICNGSSTSLTGTCGAGTLTWYTDAGLSASVGTGSPLSQSPTATITYYAACVNGSCKSPSSSISVTVTPAPTAPTITPTSTTICTGTSTNLVASGCAGTVNWYVSGSTTILNTGTTYAAGPATTTNYVATCTISGCASPVSAITTVTVTASPDASMSASTSTLCSGGTVNFTGTCISSGVAGVMTWYKNGSTTAFATGLTGISDSPTATSTYQAICTTSGTGVNAINCATNSQTITVTVVPVISPPTITPTSASICSGNSVDLTAVCTSPSTVSWTTGETTATITVNPIITTTYKAVCNQSGCSSAEGSSVITVTTTPSAPTMVTSTQSTVCVDGTISLSGSCESGSTLKWYTDTGLTTLAGTGSPLSQTLSTVGTTTYYAVCVNGTCVSPSTNKAITVVSKPTAPTAASANPSTVCSGSSATLEGTCDAGTTLEWYSDAALTTKIGTGAIITPNLTATTTYYAACNNGTCVGAKLDVIVTVTTIPAPSISAASSTICPPATDLLTATNCTGGTVTWYKDGTALTPTGSTYSATAAGVYTATCTQGTCTSVASSGVIITEFCEAPALTVVKSSSVGSPVAVGSVITYTYKVKNTGNVVLNNVGLSETEFTGTGTAPSPTWQSADASSAAGTLKVGETATYTATYTVTAADITAGSVTNQATGSGTSPGGINATGKSDSGNSPDETGSATDKTKTILCNTPATPTTTPKSICFGSNTTLDGTCSTGSILWYTSSALTTLATIPVSPTSTTNYYAVCKDGACVSASTSTTITVTNIPVITDVIAPICSDVSNWFVAFTTSGTNTSTVTTTAGTLVPYSTRADGTSAWAVNAIPNATTSITVNVTENGCTTSKTYNRPADCTTVVPNALPVKLISFTGIDTNEGVLLNWKTSEEVNSDYFEIQRSSDAINFNAIGQVKSNGYSNATKNYDFVDITAAGNIIYYRLKSVDYDEKFELSK